MLKELYKSVNFYLSGTGIKKIKKGWVKEKNIYNADFQNVLFCYKKIKGK
ncbi:MAG: hypothetical protein IKQ46_12260 [Bacteroidales bacterium]|nr:hypothetical protein [Bacteroidales bacterium]